MKVQLVGLEATKAMKEAGCPALTPELLAATGARYSRSNDGLAAILAKIDPDNPDASVDNIFRMVDYGHQSIADMAPVAMFMDGVSQLLAYLIWTRLPLAGGQEASTRYIKLKPEGLLDPSDLGIPQEDHLLWQEFSKEALRCYEESLQVWEQELTQHPQLLRIPSALLTSEDEKDQKKVARMRRNFAFDRSRYYLPLGIATNVFLVMSAREWMKLASYLQSHYLPEAEALGKALVQNLELVVPRLTKHARATISTTLGIEQEFKEWQRMALKREPFTGSEPVKSSLQIQLPSWGATDEAITRALSQHEHRYAWFGSTITMTVVRFAWDRVAFAEIRDLNRHRTGSKYCPLVPVGFYAAEDQWPASTNLTHLYKWGLKKSLGARALLNLGRQDHPYWTLLGTQYPFEHVTTADKFLYEAELRTGAGAHYRYAEHLRDMIEHWFGRFPATRDFISIGEAEPE